MTPAVALPLSSVLAYLAGSLPFGYITGRVVGRIDIRQAGSGNIGATNIGRVLGAKWGILVLALDCIKGLAPTLGLPYAFAAVDDAHLTHMQVACGMAAILGHMFPLWLGFRGGKGVATALGVLIVLGGWSTLIACGAFVLTFLASRIVSLSSIVAALSFACSQMIFLSPTPFSPEQWSLATFSLALPALIVVRHRDNIARLLRGEEKRFRTGERAVKGQDEPERPSPDS